VYRKQQRLLRERLRSVLQAKYQVELPQIAIEQPPDLEMGEYALPVAFELARRLKRSPRAIAGELVAGVLQAVPDYGNELGRSCRRAAGNPGETPK